MVKPVVVFWEWNTGYGWDVYDKTGYVGEENIKKDIRTSGRARNMN